MIPYDVELSRDMGKMMIHYRNINLFSLIIVGDEIFVWVSENSKIRIYKNPKLTQKKAETESPTPAPIRDFIRG